MIPWMENIAAFVLGVVFACSWCRLVGWSYRARLAFQRDLVTRLVERHLSLTWDPQRKLWTVELPFGTSYELAAHPRWEIAIQDALARSSHGERPESQDVKPSGGVANQKGV
jgi:hypothetical protein